MSGKDGVAFPTPAENSIAAVAAHSPMPAFATEYPEGFACLTADIAPPNAAKVIHKTTNRGKTLHAMPLILNTV